MLAGRGGRRAHVRGERRRRAASRHSGRPSLGRRPRKPRRARGIDRVRRHGFAVRTGDSRTSHGDRPRGHAGGSAAGRPLGYATTRSVGPAGGDRRRADDRPEPAGRAARPGGARGNGGGRSRRVAAPGGRRGGRPCHRREARLAGRSHRHTVARSGTRNARRHGGIGASDGRVRPLFRGRGAGRTGAFAANLAPPRQ